MLRDYSVDLYITSSEKRIPATCEALGYIVRATSIEEALSIVHAAHRKDERWNGWRLFELNLQEIDAVESQEEAACIIRGPFVQALERESQKTLFERLFRRREKEERG